VTGAMPTRLGLPAALAVAAAVVASMGAGAAAALARPPVYEVRLTTMVVERDMGSTDRIPDAFRLEGLRRTYAALARSRLVTARVAEQLGVSVGLVEERVRVVLPEDSLLVVLEARARRPELARRLVATMAVELARTFPQPGVRPGPRGPALVAAGPPQTPRRVSPNRIEGAGAAAAGGAAGLLVAGTVAGVGALRRRPAR
jgi:hypothetical protein